MRSVSTKTMLHPKA
uniref:Uncharacterized protein n=1 Tax=Anguilla anguilla TaxID=7936 RepID=A0A0E9QSZ2_ANGAN